MRQTRRDRQVGNHRTFGGIWLPAMISALLTFLAVPTKALVLNLHSDAGMATENFYPWGGVGYVVDNQTTPTPPEGKNSVRTVTGEEWGGWGLFYASPTNLSSYANGTLRFWVYTNTQNLEVKVSTQGTTGSVDIVLANNLVTQIPILNQWTYVTINLAGRGIDFTKINSPFMITAVGAPGGVFYVDQVRWSQSGDPNVIFSRSIKNRSGNTPASSFTFTVPSLPAKWVTANQYIQVDFDPGSVPDLTSGQFVPWGLQIYTNNTAVTANPRYTGTAATNPTGLVDSSSTIKRLPMCWRVVDALTSNTTIVQGSDNKLYSQELGGQASQFPCFQWMKDSATPNIVTEGTTIFSPGESAITFWDNEGLHFSDGPKNWGVNWGATKSPLYIYLGADFSTAVTPRSYGTSMLTLEFFTL